MVIKNVVGWMLAGVLVAGSVTGHEPARRADRTRTGQGAPKYRVLFNHFQAPTLTLFMADADGKNERPPPPGGLEYSPRYSRPLMDRVYRRAERAGRHLPDASDGSGVERLTDDPAFDDQGAPSPDGRTLAFVSTRGGGTTDIWLMDVASKA